MKGKIKPKDKEQDRLAINASFDDVIGASVSNISPTNKPKAKPTKKANTKKK